MVSWLSLSRRVHPGPAAISAGRRRYRAYAIIAGGQGARDTSAPLRAGRSGCSVQEADGHRWRASAPGIALTATTSKLGGGSKRGAAGLAIVLTGLLIVLTVPASLVIGLLMIVVGGATAAWVYAHVRRRSARARAERPVPLHPRVSNVRLVERLRTYIDLGPQGDYLIRADPVDGELTAVLTFGADDLDRVRSYRDKRTLSADQQVSYTVGCLLPQGRLGIRELRETRSSGGWRYQWHRGVSSGVDAPASSRLRVALAYRLSEAIDTDAGPLWITPSIRPGSQRHVLELDIQWTEFRPEGRQTARPGNLGSAADVAR